MINTKFLVLPLILTILSSGIFPFTYGTVSTEAQEDILAGCRDDQSLVYRFTYQDYICLDPPTAERWEKLGLAEIIQNATKVNQDEQDNSKTIYYGAPLPAPKSNSIDPPNDSKCRTGFTLVHRFSYDDLYCINSSTAKLWERLGLAEIIKHEQLDVNSKMVTEVLNDVDTESLPETESNSKLEYAEISPKITDNETNIISNFEESDIFDPLKIYRLNDRIVVGIGDDNKNSMLIEGDAGIVVVDTLSSYEESKKFLESIRQTTNKPITIIIHTTLTPEQVRSSQAYIEEGDGNVKVIISEGLIKSYSDIYESDVQYTHTFSSEFLINISDVKMNLLFADGGPSDQTYIYLPDDGNVILIGDSVNGIHPYILTVESFENLLD